MPNGMYRARIEQWLKENGCSDISHRIEDSAAFCADSTLELFWYDSAKETISSIEVYFPNSHTVNRFSAHLADRFVGYKLLSGPRIFEWKPCPDRYHEEALSFVSEK